MAGKTTTAAPSRGAAPPASSRTTPTAAADEASLAPAAQPANTSEEAIRARAYYLWDEAGQPFGDGVEFWLRAEQELLGRS